MRRNLMMWMVVLCALSLTLAACGDSDDGSSSGSSSGNGGCTGDCPVNAALNDPAAACAELGANKAYCFSQSGIPSSVNCLSSGHALVACFGDGQQCVVDTQSATHSAMCQ